MARPNGVAALANSVHHTVTALSRWSVADKVLPAVEKIKALHVYDFDNTLFNSPLPNPKLWNGPTIGFLQSNDTFATGGWWHNPRILAVTGDGVEIEEPRGWAGWWNEQVIQLVQLSMEQKDAVTILLTGRSESRFGDLLKKMVGSRSMDFDMVVLKPQAGPNNQRFSSTMAFKQVFLESLMETYKGAEEIRVYEDRIKHVKGFRDYFMDYNKRQNGIGGSPTRGPITAEVVQVADGATLLDPVVEVAEVQRLINEHNIAVTRGASNDPQSGVTVGKNAKRLMIKKTVFYTGYLITSTDTQKLLTLAQLPPNMPDTEMKFLANNVLITPRPAPDSILTKVGGMGNKLLWEITGTAVFENKIWAASVRPVPQNAKYYTENPVPIVVLALRKGARPIDATKIQNWQPVPPDKAHIFETTVGEKVVLRVEEEDPRENEYESLFPNKTFKRKHTQDDENTRQASGLHGRGGYQQNYSGRGQSSRGRGGNTAPRGYRGSTSRGGSGAGGRGRGRGGAAGGGHNYRSLDDVPSQTSAASQNYGGQMAYEEFAPGQKSYASQPQQMYQQPPPQQQQPVQQYQQYQQGYQPYAQQFPPQGQQNGSSGGGYYQ